MPSWMPRWDDVAVDVAAVCTAAAETRCAALDLERCCSAVGGRVDRAAPNWQGREPAAITDEIRRWVGDCIGEARRLVDVAARLESLAAGARIEQARRVSDRMRWQAEADDERRAAEAAAAEAAAAEAAAAEAAAAGPGRRV